MLPRLSARGLLVVGLLAAPAAALGYPHPGGLIRGAELVALRARSEEPTLKAARAQLQQAAAAALQEAPSAVANLDVPAYYLFAAAHTAAKKKLSDDALAAYTCALAYQLEPEGARTLYAEKARELLQAWAMTNKKVSNFDGDLVMCYAGVPLIFAAELLSDYPGWSAAERASFKSWAGGVFRGSANAIRQKSNNWGAWGTLCAMATAHLLDDSPGVKGEAARLRTKIDSAIASDGHLPAETARGKNGMWYTFFALAPMTAAATIAQRAEGEDLLAYVSPNGRSLEQALRFFHPYCLNPAAWPWGKQDDLPSASDWPGNLFEVMSAVYPRPEWESWLAPARPIRGSRGWIFASLLRRLQPLPLAASEAGASPALDAGLVADRSLAPALDAAPRLPLESEGGCSLSPRTSTPEAALLLLLLLSLEARRHR